MRAQHESEGSQYLNLILYFSGGKSDKVKLRLRWVVCLVGGGGGSCVVLGLERANAVSGSLPVGGARQDTKTRLLPIIAVVILLEPKSTLDSGIDGLV